MNEFKLQPRHRVGLACSKASSRYAIEQVKAENIGDGKARLTATDGRMLVQCIGSTSGEWESTNIDRNSMIPAAIVKAETEFRDNGHGLSFSIKAKEPQIGESGAKFPPIDDVLVPRRSQDEAIVFSVQIGLLRTMLDAMEDQQLSASDRKSQVLAIQVSRSRPLNSIVNDSDGPSNKPIRFMTVDEDGHQTVGMLMPVCNDATNTGFDEKYARRAQ
tara:strand:+ start:643 stop:1293 length:651 start_codon:yes stop_codon:yes gene_type:complete